MLGATTLLGFAAATLAVQSPAPAAGAWAEAGARHWRQCVELGERAAAARLGSSPTEPESEGDVWSERAERCPGEPEVLVLAAQEAIMAAAELSWAQEAEAPSLDPLVARHRTRLERAAQWLDAAVRASAWRGTEPPLEALYLRAYVAFALGHRAEARAWWDQARRVADVPRWRLDRMQALLDLLDGKLESAVRQARLAWTDAPDDERLISGYVWALVLDRAGAPADAASSLRVLRRESGHASARRALESLLPIHERLWLRALDHQANGETSNALRLWQAYLRRPEPVDADRKLAERHLRELQATPPPVGGPLG